MNSSNRALGYYEVAELSSQNLKNALAREEENRKQNVEGTDVTMYKPDFSQMVPFKPKIQWTPGEHIAPGKLLKLILYIKDINTLFYDKEEDSLYRLQLLNFAPCYHHLIVFMAHSLLLTL